MNNRIRMDKIPYMTDILNDLNNGDTKSITIHKATSLGPTAIIGLNKARVIQNILINSVQLGKTRMQATTLIQKLGLSDEE